MEKNKEAKEVDLGTGSVGKLLFQLALPAITAQIINVLYNMVDRMYIGHLPGEGANALTGVGVTFPVIMAISAFAALVSMGGAPRASIMLGKGRKDEAENILGNCTTALITVAVVLTAFFLIFGRRILLMFGASGNTIEYGWAYMQIYSLGTIFVQLALGLNAFINAQGYAKTGMYTVLIGAICNIILDPILMFVFHMGVRGAALATILSQMLSALWILAFLTGRRTILKLRPSAMKLDAGRLLRIVGLGMSGFTMSITNSLVQIMYNSMLQKFGGDLYVGIMTVINSVREVISMPVNGLTNSAQPVLGYNYGAREYKRVQKAIVFMSVVCILYTVVAWGFVDWFPAFFIRIFNREGDMVEAGIPAIRMYFFGFFMMSLQFAGQSVFVGLGKSRNAVFFSIFRKVIIVIPLIIILPTVFGMGTQGILMAEPISNFIGGAACFGTMLLTVWPELKRGGEKNHS